MFLYQLYPVSLVAEHPERRKFTINRRDVIVLNIGVCFIIVVSARLLGKTESFNCKG